MSEVEDLELELEILRRKTILKLDDCFKTQKFWYDKFDWATCQIEKSLQSVQNTRLISRKFMDLKEEILKIADMKNLDDLIFIQEKILILRKLGVKIAGPLWQEFDIRSSALTRLLHHLNDINTSLAVIRMNVKTYNKEQLENIEYPDYQWAQNNFTPSHFEYNPEFQEIENKVTELYEYFSKFVENNRLKFQDQSQSSTQETFGTQV